MRNQYACYSMVEWIASVHHTATNAHTIHEKDNRLCFRVLLLANKTNMSAWSFDVNPSIRWALGFKSI
jgi:hypothetical protein